MNVPKLAVTHEHGSWAVLYVPMIVAAGVGGHFDLREILFFFGATCAFLLYVPLQAVLRDGMNGRGMIGPGRGALYWLMIFGIGSFGTGLALVSLGREYLLLFAAAASVCFFSNFFLVRYFRKTIVSDLVAVVGLTLGAPAMYYCETGQINVDAFSLWVLNAMFFGSSVFYVHMKMRASRLKRNEISSSEKFSIGRLNILYHVAVVVVVLLLTFSKLTPKLAIVAYLPITIHAVFGTFRLGSNVRYRPLGFILLGQSIAFCLLLFIVEHF